jgi:pimeloyl-ACP methyl ester carboxylesterase
VRRREHAAHLMRDYPNALRVRARSTYRSPPSSWTEGTQRPVVLLPGVYETWHFLQVVGQALHERGHPVHVVRALGFNRAPIPASAAIVARELAARDLRGVALVAHSKGGLIGKQLMAQHDPDARVDRLVAVATPFGGSAMARLTVGRTMRSFLPTHPDIRSLVEAREINARITSIYPSFDPNIPEGSQLEGATNVEVPVIGHFSVLDAPSSIAAVIDAVQREGGGRG